MLNLGLVVDPALFQMVSISNHLPSTFPNFQGGPLQLTLTAAAVVANVASKCSARDWTTASLQGGGDGSSSPEDDIKSQKKSFPLSGRHSIPCPYSLNFRSPACRWIFIDHHPPFWESAWGCLIAMDTIAQHFWESSYGASSWIQLMIERRTSHHLISFTNGSGRYKIPQDGYSVLFWWVGGSFLMTQKKIAFRKFGHWTTVKLGRIHQ